MTDRGEILCYKSRTAVLTHCLDGIKIFHVIIVGRCGRIGDSLLDIGKYRGDRKIVSDLLVSCDNGGVFVLIIISGKPCLRKSDQKIGDLDVI